MLFVIVFDEAPSMLHKQKTNVYILRRVCFQLAPPLSVTMPALLERPKLSNAMARALHKHIMKERERKRQGTRVFPI